MFKKKSNDAVQTDQVDTIVGNGTEFKGNLIAKGTLRVDGKVEGEIVVQGDLIVGEKGELLAQVKARHATIAGEVKGDLKLEGTLKIARTARLHGNVTVSNLIIDEGAFFQGSCIMQAENMGDGKSFRAEKSRAVKATG